jgi:hypothetical protein
MFEDWTYIDSLFTIEGLNVLTFSWLSFWAILSFLGIVRGERYSILFVIIFHFVFCGIPLLLDVIYGKPEYFKVSGYYNPSRDNLTCIIYCLYVSTVPMIWWWTARTNRNHKTASCTDISEPFTYRTTKSPRINKLALAISFSLLILPILAWGLSPNPALFNTYGAGAGGTEASASFLLSTEEYDFYTNIISPLTQISLLGAIGILALQTRFSLKVTLFILPFLFISSWLNGKRNLPALTAFLVLSFFWSKGYLRGKRFVVACLLLILTFTLFNNFYQMQIRDREFGNNTDQSQYYESLRLDYGRDHNIKLAIYAEFHPEKAILEYRGQSFFFYSTMYIPRKFWPETKPWNYSIYHTRAATEKLILDEWVMTTTILDEAIANFSWLGMLVAPLIVSLVCRIGDSCKNSFVSTLTNLNAILFITLEFGVFNPLFILWLLMVFIVSFYKRQKILFYIKS